MAREARRKGPFRLCRRWAEGIGSARTTRRPRRPAVGGTVNHVKERVEPEPEELSEPPLVQSSICFVRAINVTARFENLGLQFLTAPGLFALSGIFADSAPSVAPVLNKVRMTTICLAGGNVTPSISVMRSERLLQIAIFVLLPTRRKPHDGAVRLAEQAHDLAITVAQVLAPTRVFGSFVPSAQKASAIAPVRQTSKQPIPTVRTRIKPSVRSDLECVTAPAIVLAIATGGTKSGTTTGNVAFCRVGCNEKEAEWEREIFTRSPPSSVFGCGGPAAFVPRLHSPSRPPPLLRPLRLPPPRPRPNPRRLIPRPLRLPLRPRRSPRLPLPAVVSSLHRCRRPSLRLSPRRQHRTAALRCPRPLRRKHHRLGRPRRQPA